MFQDEAQAAMPTAEQSHWHSSGKLPRLLPKQWSQGSLAPHALCAQEQPLSRAGLPRTRQLQQPSCYKSPKRHQPSAAAELWVEVVHAHVLQLKLRWPLSQCGWRKKRFNTSVPLTESKPRSCQGLRTLPVKCFSRWHTAHGSRAGTETNARKKSFHCPGGEA